MLSIELRDLIRNIVTDEFAEIYGLACKVSNIHEDDTLGFVCDCAPINGKASLSNVRLEPQTSGGVLIIPSDDSVVFVIMESDTQAFVSMYGVIDSIKIMGGDNKGVVKVEDLVSKMNALESAVSQLQTDFSTWVTVPNDGGAALKAVVAAGFGIKQIPDTKVSDLENTKFTH